MVKPFVHQGTDAWLQFASNETLLPVWVAICIILGCLMFSALFSGLNLGLMSLDRTELKVFIKLKNSFNRQDNFNLYQNKFISYFFVHTDSGQYRK